MFLASDTYEASLTLAASETVLYGLNNPKKIIFQLLPDLDDAILSGTRMTKSGPFLWI